MKKLGLLILLIAFCGVFGCLTDAKIDVDETITPITMSSFTPRSYKAGDSFDSDVTLSLNVPDLGTTVVYTGSLTTEMTDGGTVNGSACLLSTTTVDVTSNDPLAIAAGLQRYTYVIQVWFYEDSTGFYVVRIDDASDVTNYGGDGYGELDVPYPIGDTTSWPGVDGKTYTLDSTHQVDVNGYSFDCFKVNIDGNEFSEYLSQELGSQVSIYAATMVEGGDLETAIASYVLGQ